MKNKYPRFFLSNKGLRKILFRVNDKYTVLVEEGGLKDQLVSINEEFMVSWLKLPKTFQDLKEITIEEAALF